MAESDGAVVELLHELQDGLLLGCVASVSDDDALAAQEFEEWVREAIDSLPSGIADAVSNVEVLMRTPIRRIQSAWACTRASP